MMMMPGPSPTLAAALLLTATLIAPPAHRDPLVFIVSAQQTTTTLSAADLRNIYLGRMTRWKNGHRIAVIVRPATSDAERAFLARLVRMSDIDFSQHWLGVIFRGEAPSPPQVIASAESVEKAVAANPDSIAFLLTSETLAEDDRSIRILTVDGQAPSEARYPF
jgi:ABC-type phosphate transport system substrate-binding protein